MEDNETWKIKIEEKDDSLLICGTEKKCPTDALYEIPKYLRVRYCLQNILVCEKCYVEILACPI